MVILLKGACLKCKGKFLQAEQCFKEVLERYGDAQLQYRKENFNIVIYYRFKKICNTIVFKIYIVLNNKLQEHSDKCTHNGSRGIYSIEITIGVFVEGLGKKNEFIWSVSLR